MGRTGGIYLYSIKFKNCDNNDFLNIEYNNRDVAKIPTSIREAISKRQVYSALTLAFLIAPCSVCSGSSG
jgi:hypothetical protein